MVENSELDEINFKNVVKSPRRWFGLIYFYFITLAVIVGLHYVYNLEVIRRNDIAPALIDSANIFKDEKAIKGSVSKGIDLSQLLKPTEEMKNKGANLFKANCTSCHGENGLGDGIAGAALNPKPRNFHMKDGWKNGRKFSEMFRTLQDGVPGSGMVSYSYLPVEDRVDLIFYIRSFSNDFPPVDKSEVEAMNNQYHLAEGSNIPSRIPVSKAKEEIISESSPRVEKIYSIINYINDNPNDPGIKLLNKVSINKIKTITFLSESQTWNASLNDFVKTITATSSTNGFAPNVILLSGNEWKELYQFLYKLFSGNGLQSE
jgi:mono/diheme cytochrome c family protein